MDFKKPDITPAQIVGYLTAILSAVTILFKLDLTDAQMAAAVALIGSLVPLGHFIADAIIRKGRAGIAAAIVAAPQTVVQNAPAATGDATINTGNADNGVGGDVPVGGSGMSGGIDMAAPMPALGDGTPGHEPGDPDFTDVGAFAAAGDLDEVNDEPHHHPNDLEDGPDGALDPEQVS